MCGGACGTRRCKGRAEAKDAVTETRYTGISVHLFAPKLQETDVALDETASCSNTVDPL